MEGLAVGAEGFAGGSEEVADGAERVAEDAQNLADDAGRVPDDAEGLADAAQNLANRAEAVADGGTFASTRGIGMTRLTRGKDYWARIRAVGPNGAGAWSDPTTILLASGAVAECKSRDPPAGSFRQADLFCGAAADR